MLIAEIGVWIWVVTIIRSPRFRWRKPSFKLIFWPLLAVILICAFAGVEPLSSAKDTVFDFIEQGWEKITTSTDETGVATTSGTTTGNNTVTVDSGSTQQNSNYVDPYEVERLVFEYTNDERVLYGLSALIWDSELADIARAHSEDMSTRNYFSHYSPEGLGPTDRAKDYGYNCYKSFGSYYYDGIAENIFQGWLYSSITYYNGIPTYDWQSQSEIAVSAVESWMNSAGHRENILNTEYSNIGVGVAISEDGKVYMTQDFW